MQELLKNPTKINYFIADRSNLYAKNQMLDSYKLLIQPIAHGQKF